MSEPDSSYVAIGITRPTARFYLKFLFYLNLFIFVSKLENTAIIPQYTRKLIGIINTKAHIILSITVSIA